MNLRLNYKKDCLFVFQLNAMGTIEIGIYIINDIHFNVFI